MAARPIDVAVVGAGPYGLSVAAHLIPRGLRVGVYGKVLELWREHMPAGMRLRSHWWATHLSDPGGRFGFDRFFAEAPSHQPAYPLPIDAFIQYGQWFQQRAVPEVDQTYVRSIAPGSSGYRLTLQDGEQVDARAVVMAIGVSYFANRPAPYVTLPPDRVSHACDHRDLSRFAGQRVLVVGAGQSAIESAALLHETGAEVEVVSRRPINWLQPDRIGQRGLVERLCAPQNGLAPGWINWLLERQPYLFHRLPQPRKDRHNSHWGPTASDWLRPRVHAFGGGPRLHENRTIDSVSMGNGHIVATLSGGVTATADHLLMATGYGVDLNRLHMIDPSLRGAIRTDRGAPVLNPWFQSTAPGLYFVGFSSVRSFGPLYRFVAGCPAAARRVSASIAAALKP